MLMNYKKLYLELLYEVQRKFPNETRHETAKRYIRRMEEPSDTGSSSKRSKISIEILKGFFGC